MEDNNPNTLWQIHHDAFWPHKCNYYILTNNVFQEYWDNMVCYNDNILIFSKNMQDHEWHGCFVFNKLQKFDFMPSWKNEIFIESKWNNEFTSFLERAFTWIHA
jgi:hypothetical protein